MINVAHIIVLSQPEFVGGQLQPVLHDAEPRRARTGALAWARHIIGLDG